MPHQTPPTKRAPLLPAHPAVRVRQDPPLRAAGQPRTPPARRTSPSPHCARVRSAQGRRRRKTDDAHRIPAVLPALRFAPPAAARRHPTSTIPIALRLLMMTTPHQPLLLLRVQAIPSDRPGFVRPQTNRHAPVRSKSRKKQHGSIDQPRDALLPWHTCQPQDAPCRPTSSTRANRQKYFPR